MQNQVAQEENQTAQMEIQLVLITPEINTETVDL
jgi:hypothetical protein